MGFFIHLLFLIIQLCESYRAYSSSHINVGCMHMCLQIWGSLFIYYSSSFNSASLIEPTLLHTLMSGACTCVFKYGVLYSFIIPHHSTLRVLSSLLFFTH